MVWPVICRPVISPYINTDCLYEVLAAMLSPPVDEAETSSQETEAEAYAFIPRLHDTTGC